MVYTQGHLFLQKHFLVTRIVSKGSMVQTKFHLCFPASVQSTPLEAAQETNCYCCGVCSGFCRPQDLHHGIRAVAEKYVLHHPSRRRGLAHNGISTSALSNDLHHVLHRHICKLATYTDRTVYFLISSDCGERSK